MMREKLEESVAKLWRSELELFAKKREYTIRQIDEFDDAIAAMVDFVTGRNNDASYDSAITKATFRITTTDVEFVGSNMDISDTSIPVYTFKLPYESYDELDEIILNHVAPDLPLKYFRFERFPDTASEVLLSEGEMVELATGIHELKPEDADRLNELKKKLSQIPYEAVLCHRNFLVITYGKSAKTEYDRQLHESLSSGFYDKYKLPQLIDD